MIDSCPFLICFSASPRGKSEIASGEGEMLELKETTGLRVVACETLCAFLKKDGGTVVFGVDRNYDDRVEIINPGTFPSNITMAELRAGNKSEPRNPTIARVMYSRKTVETWGQGIVRRVGPDRGGHWEIVAEFAATQTGGK